MLDIKFIRQNNEIVKEAARKKHVEIDIDHLITLDDKRIKLSQQIEEARAQQNKASKDISILQDGEERTSRIEEMKILKESLQKKEEMLKPVMDEWQELMYRVPNVPDISVPEGNSDADNQEYKTWGEKTVFNFEPKDHIELLTNHNMLDLERGAKVHGFRGYFLLGMSVRLSFAIWQYAMDFFGNKGFVPLLPPIIVRERNLYGTGHLPNDIDDIYRTQDDDYLAGTAEVPVMGYHADEILNNEELPIKYIGFSPCYRREAGSHSKDVKGLIRVHEFYKVEQVVLCTANHEESVMWHENINRNTEEFIESLGIPYRTVTNCSGDLGLGQVKKYDIELWVPKENTYREISSASYFHDFQARRFNIRYRDTDGTVRFVHSLNCTAIPTPRILVSLVENFQNADGSITIPKILRPYLGGVEKIG